MARSVYGGRPGDTVASIFSIGSNRKVIGLPVDGNGDPYAVPLQVWDEPDGTRLTDLRAADGTTSITVVTASATTGQIPEFYAPDGYNVSVYLKDPDGDYQRMDARADAAADAAAAAQAAAEAAAASIKRDEPGGVAPLDEDSKVPDDNLPVRLSAPGLSASYVQQIVLTSNGASDQRARMQAALDSAAAASLYSTAGGKLTLIGDFTIADDTTLIIKSNVTVDATRARVYCSDNTLPILRNEHSILTIGTPTTGAGPNRDHDITIIGGTWESGTGTGAGHRLFFHQVDRVSVTDATIKTQQGKYGVLFADVTDFRAQRIKLSTYSDGIHVTGPAHRGLITDLTGTTGDDTVGTTIVDYDTYDYSRGDITDMTIERINVTSDARAVLVGGTSQAGATGSFKVLNWALRDINSDARYGIRIAANGLAAGLTTVVDNILIDGVKNDRLATTGAVNLLGGLNGSYIGTVTIRNLHITQNDPNPLATTARRYGVWVQCTDVRKITGSGWTIFDTATRETRGLFVSDTGLVAEASLDVNETFVNASSRGVLAENSGRIKSLGWNGRHSGTALILRTDNTAQVDNVRLSGSYDGASAAILHRTALPMNVHFAGFDHKSTGSAPVQLQTAAGASVKVTGSCSNNYSAGIVQRSTASQTCDVVGPGLSGELDRMNPTAGNVAYNTKGALACGTGLCAADGGAWKNLLSGASYTPTINAEMFTDTFTRTVADVVGSSPDLGGAYTGLASSWQTNGSRLIKGTALSATPVLAPARAKGDMVMTFTWHTETNGSSSITERIFVKAIDANNGVRLQRSGQTTATLNFGVVIGGTFTQIGSNNTAAIPASTAAADYACTITIATSGGTTTATCVVNGVTIASGAMDPAAVTALASAVNWGIGSTGANTQIDDVHITVNGTYA